MLIFKTSQPQQCFWETVKLWTKNSSEFIVYLVVLFGHFSGRALTLVAVVRTAGAVSTTSLHQQAAGPENHVRPLQLLTQGHRIITWSAAVEPDLLPEQVQIHHALKHTHTDFRQLFSPTFIITLRHSKIQNVWV